MTRDEHRPDDGVQDLDRAQRRRWIDRHRVAVSGLRPAGRAPSSRSTTRRSCARRAHVAGRRSRARSSAGRSGNRSRPRDPGAAPAARNSSASASRLLNTCWRGSAKTSCQVRSFAPGMRPASYSRGLRASSSTTPPAFIRACTSSAVTRSLRAKRRREGARRRRHRRAGDRPLLGSPLGDAAVEHRHARVPQVVEHEEQPPGRQRLAVDHDVRLVRDAGLPQHRRRDRRSRPGRARPASSSAIRAARRARRRSAPRRASPDPSTARPGPGRRGARSASPWRRAAAPRRRASGPRRRRRRVNRETEGDERDATHEIP